MSFLCSMRWRHRRFRPPIIVEADTVAAASYVCWMVRLSMFRTAWWIFRTMKYSAAVAVQRHISRLHYRMIEPGHKIEMKYEKRLDRALFF
jgi:hypothetical protein